jgi:hypothetical protein
MKSIPSLLVAYGNITKYIRATDKETLDRFWLSVESFLIAVANISKFYGLHVLVNAINVISNLNYAQKPQHADKISGQF